MSTTLFKSTALLFFFFVATLPCLAAIALPDSGRTDTTKATQPIPRITDTTKAARSDSGKTDTTKIKQQVSRETDTAKTARRDTVRQRITPIRLLGSIDRSLDDFSVLPDTQINYLDYIYTGDLFMMRGGVFVRDLGSPGQLNDLTINGLGEKSINIMADGVPLNDPLTGLFDLYLYPSENIGRIEFIPETQSFLYGLNGTGGAINFMSKNRKALHPYSRIHYIEDEYGFSTFDGLVSQNISRDINVMLGVEHTTTGGKFTNEEYEQWSGRFKIRDDVSGNVDLFASAMYNSTVLSLSGGVVDTIPYAARYDQNLADVWYPGEYEKVSRYDLQAGAGLKLFSDSTLISTVTFYHSTNFRQFRDAPTVNNEGNVVGLNLAYDHRSQWFGMNYAQDLVVGRQHLDLGAELERLGVIASPATQQHLESRQALYGKTSLSPVENLIVSGYARYDQYFSQSKLGYGADAVLNTGSPVEFFGGYSHSYRFPTFQELYWRDSIITSDLTSANPETHDLLEAGLRLNADSVVHMELKYFNRTIHDLITLSPVSGQPPPVFVFTRRSLEDIHGVSGDASFRLGKFFAEGTAQYLVIDTSSQQALPKFSAIGSIYYWSNLLHDHLNLKAGFRGRLVTDYLAPRFIPQDQIVLPYDFNDVGTVGILDFVMVAKIDNAYLHFTWYNLFDQWYFLASYYPMPGRGIRFGVSWDFTD